MQKKGVPSRFATAVIGDLAPDVQAALAKVGDNSVLFYGDTGRGKTYAMAALLRAVAPSVYRDYGAPDAVEGRPVLNAGVDALWLDVPLWLYELRQSFHGGEAPAVKLPRACNVRLLCLDDVGAENVTDWTSETLYIIVSQREAYGLRTFVTTNLPLADLRTWNPRLASRLMAYKRVAMSGDDRRLRNGK